MLRAAAPPDLPACLQAARAPARRCG